MRKTMRFTALLPVLALLLACLTLPAGASFESEYKSYRGEWAGGGLSPIKMKLEEDTLTLDYSPVFYFDQGFGLTEPEKESIIDDCVAGFMEWEGIYTIGGRELTVVVDVHPSESGSRLCSSVRILPNSGFSSGGMVPGCVIWRPASPFLAINLRTQNPQYRNFEYLAAHEFGHVLGLFDAYGYDDYSYTFLGRDLSGLFGRLLPEAPLDRAPYRSIMRSGWAVTATEIEMLLWAWKNNRLQLYTKSVLTWLGAQVSPAFSN